MSRYRNNVWCGFESVFSPFGEIKDKYDDIILMLPPTSFSIPLHSNCVSQILYTPVPSSLSPSVSVFLSLSFSLSLSISLFSLSLSLSLSLCLSLYLSISPSIYLYISLAPSHFLSFSFLSSFLLFFLPFFISFFIAFFLLLLSFFIYLFLVHPGSQYTCGRGVRTPIRFCAFQSCCLSVRSCGGHTGRCIMVRDYS